VTAVNRDLPVTRATLPAWLGAALLALSAVICLGVLAAIVVRLGPFPALALVLGLTASVVFIVKPHTATLVTAFLLYANVPAILSKQGVPGVAAGAFILLLAVPIAHATVLRREPLRFDTTFGLMFAWLAIVLVSSMGAVDHGIALNWVRDYAAEGLLLYWLIVNAVRGMDALRTLLWAVLAAASLLSVLSLYQDATGSYQQQFGGLATRAYDASREIASLGSAVRLNQKWDRAQGPVDEPNRFAQIMLVLVPMAGFLYRTARTRNAAVLAAALGAMTLLGVVLTLSRGAFVTLAVVFAAMTVVRWVRPSHVVAGLLSVVVLASVVSPFFLSRLVSILDARYLLGGGASYQEADGAIRGRTTEMLAALHVFRDYPVFGVGPGQFPRFYFVDYSKSADIKFRDIVVPRRAHNLYLELAAELGAVGLAVFLAIVGLLMRALGAARRAVAAHDEEAADLAGAMWLGLLAYLVSGMFLHLAYQRYFWLLLAMASSALHIVRSRHPEIAWGTAIRVRPAPAREAVR
jgi:O-antigen ligase